MRTGRAYLLVVGVPALQRSQCAGGSIRRSDTPETTFEGPKIGPPCPRPAPEAFVRFFRIALCRSSSVLWFL